MAESASKVPPGTNNPHAKELYDQAGKLFEENKFDEAIALYSQAIKQRILIIRALTSIGRSPTRY